MSSRTNMMKMGKYIAKLRKRKGYTQKNLGDILDVSDKTVSKWEKGVVAPDITILNALAISLDVSVEELLAGEDSKTTNPVEAIDMYSSIIKKKIIKYFSILIFAIIISTFLIFRIEEYYAWHITSLYSEGNISSTGYILSNNKESKVVINKFAINDKSYNKNDIESINIKIGYKNDIIFSEEIRVDENASLETILNNFGVYADYDNRLYKDYLKIEVDINFVSSNILVYESYYK